MGMKKKPNEELIKKIERMNNDERINYLADNPIIENKYKIAKEIQKKSYLPEI